MEERKEVFKYITDHLLYSSSYYSSSTRSDEEEEEEEQQPAVIVFWKGKRKRVRERRRSTSSSSSSSGRSAAATINNRALEEKWAIVRESRAIKPINSMAAEGIIITLDHCSGTEEWATERREKRAIVHTDTTPGPRRGEESLAPGHLFQSGQFQL